VTRFGKITAHGAVVLTAALLLSGCSLAGRSFGRYVDDASLTGGVKVRLAAAHLSHLKRVNVDVYEGVVYLSGVVNTALEKSDAEIAAWEATGVEQVVNDIVVRERASEAVSALPDLRPRNPLTERFAWVTRVESSAPGGPDLAYDATGQLVATVYTVSARGLVNAGAATLPAGGHPVDRVTIYALPAREDLPESLYSVVLWHVPERAAGRH
jgi:hypothetical protein